nr:unnamed protein product [Spirometra erinaceieuropaei]
MQRSIDLLVTACGNFGRIIKTDKAVVTHQPPPDIVYGAPQINMNDIQLQAVDNFIYIGRTLSRNTKIGDEVAHRMSEVSPALGRLQNTVWNCQFSTQHQTEDVQIGHPDDAVTWGRDLDGVQEAGARIKPLPPQLSPTDTEAEVAGLDSNKGRNGTEGSPQHLRPAETTETALERPLPVHGRPVTQTTLLWRCRHEFPPTRRSSTVLRGYSEGLSEMPVN